MKFGETREMGIPNKIKRLLRGQKPLDRLDQSFLKRYSRTSTCISSSRSILQIIARALL